LNRKGAKAQRKRKGKMHAGRDIPGDIQYHQFIDQMVAFFARSPSRLCG
jgi:hypothetical protein